MGGRAAPDAARAHAGQGTAILAVGLLFQREDKAFVELGERKRDAELGQGEIDSAIRISCVQPSPARA
jgi:hypothetical protein